MLENTLTSIIGSRLRSSNTTKPTSTTADAISGTRMTAELKPCTGASTSANAERADADDEQHLPDGVEAVLLRVRRLPDEEIGEHDGDGAHDRVHHEDRAPAEAVGEHAAHRGPDGQADRGDAGPQPDRLGLGRRIGVGGAHQRQRRHVHDRRTDALHGPGDVEHVDVRRQAAGQRGAAEDDQAGDEGPAPTPPVGDRGRGHHEHAHRQAVRGHDPLQPALTDGELVLDRRQGDVHDRGVEEDHEQPEARGHEHEGRMRGLRPGHHPASVARRTSRKGGLPARMPRWAASGVPRPGGSARAWGPRARPATFCDACHVM